MRIAVTGIGLVTPLGLCSQANVDRIRKAESAIGPMRRIDSSAHPCNASAEVPEFDLANSLRLAKNFKFMTWPVQCAARAAMEAIHESRFPFDTVAPERVACYTGSGQTGLEYDEFFPALTVAWAGDREHDFGYLSGRATKVIDPYFSLRTLSNIGIALLSMELEMRGPSANYVHSDTASVMALQSACYDLLENRCDVALVGGYESLLRPSVYLAYEKAGFLSSSPSDTAHRPFDIARDGIVLGEGAGFLVLERWDDAQARGARVLGEIEAIGCTMQTNDAPEGDDAPRRVIEQVMAGRPKVDFIVARGFGFPDSDAREGALLHSMMGRELPVTAFKGATGYLGAATAAVELGLGLLCARSSFLPAIVRCDNPDPACAVDLVTANRPLLGDRLAGLFLSQSWAGQAAAMVASAVGG